MSDDWPDGPPPIRSVGLPDHVITPLLTRITAGSLDEDYRQVAQRKVSSGASPPPAGRPHLVAAAVIAAFGVLITTAALQTNAQADVTDAGRATLIARIKDERAQVEREQERIAALQDDTIALQDDLERTTADQQQAAARRLRLEVRTGYVAVRGEGLRIIVNDAPGSDPNQLVRDEDLALLVNGLWRAGAEAVAINGQRLTVLAGIRNRGIAIRVGGQPVNPPYNVQAVGDIDTLAANLLDTTHGQQFFDLADQLGFSYSMDNEVDLVLPAAGGPRLLHVRAGVAGKPGMDENEEAKP